MKKITRLSLVVLAVAATFTMLARAQAADTRRAPTVEDLLALKSVGTPRLSPDGTRIAYTVTEADFEQDAYVTQIWLMDIASGEAIPLTRGKKSSSDPTWSPDGRWIAFTSSRVDDKSQLFAIRPDGGEAVQLTKAETGVGGFDWSPDGRTIAFTAGDPVPDESKARKDHYGDYAVVRREYAHTHLYTVDTAEALRAPQAGKRRTSGKSFTVGGFSWSPDGKRIAFGAADDPDLINGGTSDIYVLELAGDVVTKIVDQPGPDGGPVWSPDGRSILFSSALGRPDYFARNSVLAVVPASGGRVSSRCPGPSTRIPTSRPGTRTASISRPRRGPPPISSGSTRRRSPSSASAARTPRWSRASASRRTGSAWRSSSTPPPPSARSASRGSPGNPGS